MTPQLAGVEADAHVRSASVSHRLIDTVGRLQGRIARRVSRLEDFVSGILSRRAAHEAATNRTETVRTELSTDAQRPRGRLVQFGAKVILAIADSVIVNLALEVIGVASWSWQAIALGAAVALGLITLTGPLAHAVTSQVLVERGVLPGEYRPGRTAWITASVLAAVVAGLMLAITVLRESWVAALAALGAQQAAAGDPLGIGGGGVVTPEVPVWAIGVLGAATAVVAFLFEYTFYEPRVARFDAVRREERMANTSLRAYTWWANRTIIGPTERDLAAIDAARAHATGELGLISTHAREQKVAVVAADPITYSSTPTPIIYGLTRQLEVNEPTTEDSPETRARAILSRLHPAGGPAVAQPTAPPQVTHTPAVPQLAMTVRPLSLNGHRTGTGPTTG